MKEAVHPIVTTGLPSTDSALLKGIITTAADAIVCADETGRIVLFNPAAEEMFGYAGEEVLGQNVSLLMPSPDRDHHDLFIARYLQTREARLDCNGREVLAQRRNGDTFHVHLALSSVEFAGRLYFTTVIRDISRRKATESALAKSEAKYRTVFEAAPEGVWLIDPQHRILQVNRRLSQLLGYAIEEMVGRTPQDLVVADSRGLFAEQMDGIGFTERRSCDVELRHKDGHGVPCHVSAVTLRNRDGSVDASLAFVADLTKRKQAENRLREEREFLQSIIDGVSDPIMVVSADYAVLLMNQAARNLSGRCAKPGLHQRCYQVSHDQDEPCGSDEHPCPLQRVMETGQQVCVTHRHSTVDGMRSVELSATPLWNGDGSLRGVIEVSRDITKQLEMMSALKAQETHMEQLAHHDALTGLPNRLLFGDRLEQAIHRAHREEACFSLLFIDLDRFKQINDSFGHAFGDKLLRAVAVRLQEIMREEDTVARLGGDEFVILAHSLIHYDDAGVAAQRFIERLQNPFIVDDQELYVTTSIGICLYPHDGGDSETLLRNADAAMYRAKEDGRNTFQYYTAAITDQAYERVFITTGLRRALEQGEFTLYYQPQMDMRSAALIGVEALIRWQHPEMGLVPPEKFIPLAEDTGLIMSIGYWVLQTACEQWVAWRSQGLDLGRIAVNLSGRQLERPALVDDITGILSATGCPPHALELEITEGSIMRDPDHAAWALAQLRDMGFKIAIDDFGTGYSSLSQLKRLPITKLKIDASFVRDIPHDSNDVAITSAIIAMAKSLQLDLMAEGVETEAQRAFLIGQGCVNAQGYFYNQPLNAAAIEALGRSLETALPLARVFK